MLTGLFFGSFNPVHVGHMIIANHMVEFSEMKDVWLVVSPHNPLKEKKSLAPDYVRLEMVHLAIGDNLKIRASDIEFSLPKPSYTVDTLAYIKEKFPKREFALIMGSDNLGSIHKWKNYHILLRDYKIFVYARPGYHLGQFAEHENVHIVEAPLLEISASHIRNSISEEKSIRYLVTEKVYDYLEATRYYRNK